MAGCNGPPIHITSNNRSTGNDTWLETMDRHHVMYRITIERDNSENKWTILPS